MTVDPRLLSRFDAKSGRWRLAEGSYRVALGKSAGDFVQKAEMTLKARLFGT
ncbi:hypothetical protein D3C86_1708170 [compost metagenome]